MSDAPPMPVLKRTNFIVADLDRSLALYRDALGFRVAYTKEAPPGFVVFGAFEIPTSARVRLCALSTPSQDLAFELTEVTGVPLPPLSGLKRAAILLAVSDVNSAGKTIEALGTCTLLDPAPVKGPDGAVRGIQRPVIDPDGNTLVIYSLTP